MGRRWGKTTTGGGFAVACANRGASVAWVVPTYRNARPLWRFCEQAVSQVPKRVRMSRSDMLIEFPATHGRLCIYTADNDNSMRGEAFHVVIADEAPLMRQETWTDVLMPTLADYNGMAVLIGTPKGMNWFYTEFMRGMSGEAGYRSYHAPSSANPLPNIQRAALLAKERVSERTYRQEWLAEFIESGGLVLRNVDALATLAPKEPAKDHTYVGGIDWGRFNDATVFVVLDVTANEMVYLDRMVDVNFALQLTRLTALHARYSVGVWIAEYNSLGGPQVEALQHAGLPVRAFNTTNATKAVIIDGLALAMEQQKIGLLKHPVLVGELKAFTSERTPSGMTRYTAPEGMHDDCVMATALAYAGMARRMQSA